MEVLPGPIVAPAREVLVSRRPADQIVGQEAPSTAGADEVQEAVDDFATIYAPRPATKLGGRDERGDPCPLLVCQISRVRLSSHPEAIGQAPDLEKQALWAAARRRALGLVEVDKQDPLPQ
jgi:hypothetical protein